MKKLTALICLAMASAQPLAAPLDLYMNQLSVDGTGYLNRQLTVPNGGVGVDGILYYNGTTQLPMIATFATGCSISFGVLTCSGTPQTNADWNATSGAGQILNKPTTLAGYGITDAYPLTGNPSGFLTGITSGQVTTALGFTPYNATNPAGYITSSALSPYLTSATAASTYATQSALTSGLAGKFNTPTGTTSQYIRGDGSLATFPTTPAMVVNDAPGRSLVTSTSATGYQVSATRNARVCYEGTFSTTSTIGGPASASVFLETADTNSTTPGDWTTRAQQTYTNTITLAVVLNQVQANNWSMCRDIPAGKFVRIRAGSISGTASVSLNAAQQETTY